MFRGYSEWDISQPPVVIPFPFVLSPISWGTGPFSWMVRVVRLGLCDMGTDPFGKHGLKAGPS